MSFYLHKAIFKNEPLENIPVLVAELALEERLNDLSPITPAFITVEEVNYPYSAAIPQPYGVVIDKAGNFNFINRRGRKVLLIDGENILFDKKGTPETWDTAMIGLKQDPELLDFFIKLCIVTVFKIKTKTNTYIDYLTGKESKRKNAVSLVWSSSPDLRHNVHAQVADVVDERTLTAVSLSLLKRNPDLLTQITEAIPEHEPPAVALPGPPAVALPGPPAVALPGEGQGDATGPAAAPVAAWVSGRGGRSTRGRGGRSTRGRGRGGPQAAPVAAYVPPAAVALPVAQPVEQPVAQPGQGVRNPFGRSSGRGRGGPQAAPAAVALPVAQPVEQPGAAATGAAGSSRSGRSSGRGRGGPQAAPAAVAQPGQGVRNPFGRSSGRGRGGPGGTIIKNYKNLYIKYKTKYYILQKLTKG